MGDDTSQPCTPSLDMLGGKAIEESKLTRPWLMTSHQGAPMVSERKQLTSF